MKIHVKRGPEAAFITLSGDFISEVDQLELREKVETLVGGERIHLVIDFGGVKYINSCGLGSLVCVLTKVRKAGGDLHLVGVGGDVAKVIKLTRLDAILPISPSVETAISELGIHAL